MAVEQQQRQEMAKARIRIYLRQRLPSVKEETIFEIAEDWWETVVGASVETFRDVQRRGE